MNRLTYENEVTFFDVKPIQEELVIMTRWHAIVDDIRKSGNINNEIRDFLKIGNSYKITLILERIK